MNSHSLDITVPIGVDLIQPILTYKRIVFRDTSIIVQPEYIAVGKGQVLRLVLFSPVTNGKVEVSVVIKSNSASKMVASFSKFVARINLLTIDEFITLEPHPLQRCYSSIGGPGLGKTQVDPSVIFIVWV